ncbi:PAS domain S-box protein [Christiangramia sediminis]|uniref:histidine kinase n=1 Tax=Christiangramia sediminis TaxID=2881336 RepID=A0A9X1RZC2_9FLAO|nr:PAS domain S-box protein [Christiangramia sediminis]MCB7482120.1 PAS domain-containing sensor histidine kinase [Christiangramia sediminis]
MSYTSEDSENKKKKDSAIKSLSRSIVDTVQEPMLILDVDLNFINANTGFYNTFEIVNEQALQLELEQNNPHFKQLKSNLEAELAVNKNIENSEFSLVLPKSGVRKFLINASKIDDPELILVSFTEQKDNLEKFDEIFSQAPAMICILRGPEHVFDRANENYLQIVGNRDIIGKTVRQAVPELDGQGFYEMLDNVYKTGKAFTGSEIPVKIDNGEKKLKNSFLDFVYQPIFEESGAVGGIFVHAIDITEKVKAIRKLEESENELRNLIDTVPAIIWITSESGKNSYLNKKWYEFTGQTQSEAHDFGWLNVIHPEDRKRVEKEFLKSNNERSPFHASFRLRNSEGDYRWVLDSGSPKYNSEGAYEGMIGTVIDINEEKIKEQLIREKQHRIRSIIEEADVATALYTGREMKIEMANDAMIELWGKDHSVIGKTLHEALPELEGQPFHELLQNVYTTGKTYWGKEDPVDLVINNKLHTGYFNFTYKALSDEKGEIYGILNMAVDVSEIVESKKLLKDSEERYRQMADLMPEKVSNIDPQGNVVYFNQGWLDYTGLSKEEFEEQGLNSFISPAEKDEFEKAWNYSLETGNDFEMELRYLNKKGKYKWHLNRAEAITDANGDIQLWICTATEIQKIKAEEKRKEDFLKLVSHELKTPVTSIKGYVQLLLSLLKSEKGVPLTAIPFQTSLERIDQQVVRLTRLISEMLDLSRIEKNKLVLKKENFSLNKLIAETIQDINYTNTQYNIKLTEEFDCNIYADKDRIGQVLINLVTNAIKYSPENQDIEVKIEKEGKNKVAVSVIDSGIGIDKENQKKIFKRFYRIDFKHEDTYSGFGIGLYLANEIMRRHNGKISVDSEKDKGSVFTFSLDVVSKDFKE